MARKKHRPQRTCVSCRQVEDKGDLIRIVRTPEGVFVDPTGKRSGRGAYVHPKESCWKEGIETSLETALRTTLTEDDKERLKSSLSQIVEVEREDS